MLQWILYNCDVEIYLLFNLQNFDWNLLILRLKCAFRNDESTFKGAIKNAKSLCTIYNYNYHYERKIYLIFHLSTYFVYV